MRANRLNPRQEAFCRHYVRLGNARQAYVLAGYNARLDDIAGANPVDVNAGRLLRNAKVEQRIHGIRTAMAKRADVTEESILDELEQARLLAMGIESPAAAVTASVAKAKLVGLMVERKEIGDAGDFSRMSEAELRAYINDNSAPTSEVQADPIPTHPGTPQRQ